MSQTVRIGIGIALAALVSRSPAQAQWFGRHYHYYVPVPVPVYPPAYYPPPVYRPVYPPTYVPAYRPAYVPPQPSASIMAVQRSLATLGYDPGPVDGLPGPRLSGAVQSFQRDHGVPVTGRLSGETIGAIQEAARSRSTQSVPETAAAPTGEPPVGNVVPTPESDAPAANSAPSTLSVKPTTQ
jgi:peptidoglycan hydrolase-like protein with peptidoglycan-binding domain